MLTKTEILDYLISNKEYFRTKFQINKIGLFGSFARDEQNDTSDIDIVVDFEENTADIFEKKTEIRAMFKDTFNREVDICTPKYIKPYAKKYILKDLLYV